MTSVEFLVAVGAIFALVLLVTHWMANTNLKIRNLESQARVSSDRHEATLAVLTSFREALNYEQQRAETATPEDGGR